MTSQKILPRKIVGIYFSEVVAYKINRQLQFLPIQSSSKFCLKFSRNMPVKTCSVHCGQKYGENFISTIFMVNIVCILPKLLGTINAETRNLSSLKVDWHFPTTIRISRPTQQHKLPDFCQQRFAIRTPHNGAGRTKNNENFSFF